MDDRRAQSNDRVGPDPTCGPFAISIPVQLCCQAMREHLPSLLIRAGVFLRAGTHFFHHFAHFLGVGLLNARSWPWISSRRSRAKASITVRHLPRNSHRSSTVWEQNLCKTRAVAKCRDNIYIITGPARTGSTMLVQLLRSHPEICSHSELFSPNKITGMTGVYLQKSREEPGFIERLSNERDRDPIKFLYKIALDSQGRKVVGFKLKHDELVLPEYKTLRDEIAGDLDFRIIHLRRENLLRRFLSWHIANHITHITLAVGPQAIPDVPRVRLDPSKCQRDFETTEKREKEFRELFAKHQSFSISYEELVSGNSDKVSALLSFLEVSPRELTTTTKKLGNDDLRKAIANFDELRAHFAGSRFANFFERA
jgi:LPS sulfotransferase NodH